MQGLSAEEPGFCVVTSSTVERLESLSLAPHSQYVSVFTPSLRSSGDFSKVGDRTSSGLDISWSSRTESLPHSCGSTLQRKGKSNSSSLSHSRPATMLDVNLRNAAEGEAEKQKLMPAFQELVVNSDFSQVSTAGLLESDSETTVGGFLQDLKNNSDYSAFHVDGLCESPGMLVGSPSSSEALSGYEKYLASSLDDSCTSEDLYSSDEFRMFEFKVRRCMRGRSHDWTECPFAHPGEKARRRDPRRFHYSGAACPDFRKGNCKRGDSCEFAHGVFECWLHPARYRTQPCKDGTNCKRRVCFFAHTPEQLRLLPAAAQAATAALRSNKTCQKPLLGSDAWGSQNDSCCGSFDGSSTVQSVPGDSVDANSISYERIGCTGHGSFDGSCSRHGSCRSGPSCFKVATQLYSFNCATHGGICCVSPLISSPRSTLVGLSQSPPTHSPPLSPLESPPTSPEDWHSSNLQSLPIVTTRGGLSYTLSSPTQVSQMHGLVSRDHSYISLAPSSGFTSPHTSAHVVASAQRQCIDRLNSIPALAIPNLGQKRLLQTLASAPTSPHNAAPTASSTNDLVTNLQQQLELNSVIPIWPQAAQASQLSSLYTSGPSPLRRSSQSVPSTPSQGGDDKAAELWDVDVLEDDEVAMPRVESGRILRAKIYGKLGKAGRLDLADSPDLGWVNDLVEE